jgi:hypothetical protein
VLLFALGFDFDETHGLESGVCWRRSANEGGNFAAIRWRIRACPGAWGNGKKLR